MDNTIIQSGTFTATGSPQILQVRSDFDFIKIYNLTSAALTGGATDLGYEFLWQRGMTNGAGMIWTKLDTVANDPITVGEMTAPAGITVIDSSVITPGANVAITACSSATQPVYSTATTTGLSTGTIVRLNNALGQLQLCGIDFEVGAVTAGVSFAMRYALASAPAAGTTANYRIIPFDALYYPRRRYIVNMTAAASAVITFSVTHGFTVGQQLRFHVPSRFGMTQMDQLAGTITAVNTTTNTVTVNIDSTGFTAFAIPTSANYGTTWAHAVPLGEDTPQALSSSVDILADSTLNTGYIGVSLANGALSPAGRSAADKGGAPEVSDVIYWQAYKVFNGV